MATRPKKDDAKKAKESVKDLTSGITADGTFKLQGETVIKQTFGCVVETNY